MRSPVSQALGATTPGPDSEAVEMSSTIRAAEKVDESLILPTHRDKDNNKRHGLFRMDASAASRRRGVHPLHFLKICFKSTCTLSMIVNILWPFVPAAIAVRYARPDLHVWVFALNYIAIVPSANLLGFAGGELAEKLPKVFGILLETTLTSVVEIVLFMVLIHKDNGGKLVPVVQAAILGSILANLLLCLGLCFFFGGMRRDEQTFHEAISEVGSGLLLVAGFGLMIPSAFYSVLKGSTSATHFTPEKLADDAIKISRSTCVVLLIAFCM